MRRILALAALLAALPLAFSAAEASNLSGTYLMFGDLDGKCANENWNRQGFARACAGVNLRVQRSGLAWVGKVVHAPPRGPAGYQNRGMGWMAFNVRPNMSGPASCMAGGQSAALLYGSVFDQVSGVMKAGYILAVPRSTTYGAGADMEIYFLPGVSDPVLPGGQCNNRATYGKDRFTKLTPDTGPMPWHGN